MDGRMDIIWVQEGFFGGSHTLFALHPAMHSVALPDISKFRYEEPEQHHEEACLFCQRWPFSLGDNDTLQSGEVLRIHGTS